MKDLNINAMGVTAMSAKEMKTTDGGWVWWVIWGVKQTARYTLPAMAETAAGGGTTIGNIGGAK